MLLPIRKATNEATLFSRAVFSLGKHQIQVEKFLKKENTK